MDAKHSRHLPTLDGVRGLAACVVVISHSASLGLLPLFLGDRFGQQAVLLFFTLSGFLMVHLYAQRPFKFAEIASYFSHRIGRVVPLFYLVVLLSWALLHTTIPVWVFPVDSVRTLSNHLFFLNGVSSLWTVPVEIQFYAVFLALWFAFSKNRFLLGLGIVQILALMLVAAEHIWSLSLGLLPSTIQFFLIGSFIAFARKHLRIYDAVTAPRIMKWLPLAILFFAVFSSSIVRQHLRLHMAATWWDPILGGLPVLVFIAALQSIKPFNLLATAPLRWLGQISYGIYIFHFPVLVTLQRMIAATGLWQRLGVVALVCITTLILSAVSYIFFERPLRKAIAAENRRRPLSASHAKKFASPSDVR